MAVCGERLMLAIVTGLRGLVNSAHQSWWGASVPLKYGVDAIAVLGYGCTLPCRADVARRNRLVRGRLTPCK